MNEQETAASVNEQTFSSLREPLIFGVEMYTASTTSTTDHICLGNPINAGHTGNIAGHAGADGGVMRTDAARALSVDGGHVHGNISQSLRHQTWSFPQGLDISKNHVIFEVSVRVLFLLIIVWWGRVIAPFHRISRFDDLYHYSFPYNPDSMEHTTLLLFLVLAFCILVLVCGLLQRIIYGPAYCRKRFVYELWTALLGFSFAIVAANAVIDFIKPLFGRMRPDFLSRCFPEHAHSYRRESEEAPYIPKDQFGRLWCTHQDQSLLNEGRKSFPSGHTGTAFAGCVWMALILNEKLRCVPLGQCRLGVLLTAGVLGILPAIFVGISRIFDYRHHPEDVVVGALIGSLAAIMGFSYHPGTLPLLAASTTKE